MNIDKTINNIRSLPINTDQDSAQHSTLFRLIKKLSSMKNHSFFEFTDDFIELVSANTRSFAIPKEINLSHQEEYYQLPLYHGNADVKAWSLLNTHFFRLTTFLFNKEETTSSVECKLHNRCALKIVPNDTILYFTKADGAVLDVYEITDELDAEKACQSIALKSSLSLHDGAVVRLKAGLHAAHLRVIKNDMMYHEITYPESDIKVIGEYDINTLQLVDVNVANLFSYQAEMFAELVANFNQKTSIPVLKKLGAHTDSFVRWNAAMNLYTLDSDAGLQLMHELTQDPNPDVKATAQRCCEIIFEQS